MTHAGGPSRLRETTSRMLHFLPDSLSSPVTSTDRRQYHTLRKSNGSLARRAGSSQTWASNTTITFVRVDAKQTWPTSRPPRHLASGRIDRLDVNPIRHRATRNLSWMRRSQSEAGCARRTASARLAHAFSQKAVRDMGFMDRTPPFPTDSTQGTTSKQSTRFTRDEPPPLKTLEIAASHVPASPSRIRDAKMLKGRGTPTALQSNLAPNGHRLPFQGPYTKYPGYGPMPGQKAKS